MKKNIIYIFALLVSSVLFFTACDDPYADQVVADPTINEQGPIQDANFVFALKTGVNPIVIDVNELDDTLALYNCTTIPTLIDTAATVSYTLQISNMSDFSSYATIKTIFSGKVNSDLKIPYKDLNDSLLVYNDAVAEQTVYTRVVAVISNSGLQAAVKTAVVTLKATPYKSPLQSYTINKPRPYYIIGMADGAWNNSVAGLGVSIFPMTVVEGDHFNADGDGKFTFTGYFTTSRGFKLIRNVGNWDEQWGAQSNNDITKPVRNDGGSGDFRVPADGYYTISLNSVEHTLTIVASSATPTSYTQIGLIGGFNGWGSDIVMTPCETSNNHNWYTTVTFTGNDQGKFRANGGWDINWGSAGSSDGNPLYMFTGIGGQGGKNIGVKAGTFVVIFNDIDGGYWFIEK